MRFDRRKVKDLRKEVKELFEELYGEDFVRFLEFVYPYLDAFFSEEENRFVYEDLKKLRSLLKSELEKSA